VRKNRLNPDDRPPRNICSSARVYVSSVQILNQKMRRSQSILEQVKMAKTGLGCLGLDQLSSQQKQVGGNLLYSVVPRSSFRCSFLGVWCTQSLVLWFQVV